MKKYIWLGVVVLALSSCGGPTQEQYDRLFEENLSLKIKVDLLKSELSDYKDTPDSLYSRALICNKREDIDGLAHCCSELEKNHPSSWECKQAKKYLQSLKEQKERIETTNKIKRKAILYSLRHEEDQEQGVTWYYDPNYIFGSERPLTVYIGEKTTGDPWLRLYLSVYHKGYSNAPDYLNIEHFIVSYDNNEIEIPFKGDNYKKKQSALVTREWIDVPVSDQMIKHLRSISESKKVEIAVYNAKGKCNVIREVIKHIGDYIYVNDLELSEYEIRSIGKMLLAYDVLKKGE